MKSRRNAETSSSALLPRWLGAFATIGLLASATAFAADPIKGRVLGAGAPIVGSTVTLWAAGAGAPTQLAQTRSNAEGGFELSADGKGADVYVVATGGRLATNAAAGENPAIALMTVLGNNPPDDVVVNEMTTVAWVWTHNQFIDGAAIKGPA
jgi:hypothetical protein